MKEKVKNYLFCLCALAMCLMFALAIFFKSCNSVKAADVSLGSNLTYNEGQSTYFTSSSGYTYSLQLLYGGGASQSSSSNKFEFIYYSNSPYATTGTSVNIFIMSACTRGVTDDLLSFTCPNLDYLSGPSTSSPTINGVSAITSSNPIVVKVESYDTLTGFANNFFFDKFYYTSSSYYSNIRFYTSGNTYNDGYLKGYQDAVESTYNDMYYNACLSVNGVSSNCSTSYFTSKYGSDLPTISINSILSDILSVYGISNNGLDFVSMYDFVRNKYLSNINQCNSIVNASCIIWNSTDISLSNVEFGLNAYINNTNIINYTSNYNNGYTQGRADGVVVGVEEGKIIGYSQGFVDGQESEDIVGNAVLSVASTPLMILSGMLNFNIFGFNVLGLVLGLFTFVLVLWILKKVF